MSRKHHIAVDLDGTLAQYDGWKGHRHIGDPVPSVLARAIAAIAAGHRVTIYTARLDPLHDDVDEARSVVLAWAKSHGLDVDATATKLASFSEFWDDRAIRVAKNEGVASLPTSDTAWESCTP